MKTTYHVIIVLLLSSCSFFKPYHPIQRQGAPIEQTAIEQLTLGMSKSQVTYLLGLPILTDAFTEDQWQYLFTEKTKDDVQIKQKLILQFENEQLSDIQQAKSQP